MNEELISVYKPFYKRHELSAVLSCLIEGDVHTGTEYKEFLHALKQITGMYKGVVLRDPLRALETAFRILGIKKGDRVALSPLIQHAAVTNADSDIGSKLQKNTLYNYALSSYNIEAVYIDTLPGSPIIDINAIRRLHTEEKIHAIILDHPFGQLPDLEYLRQLNIPIIQNIDTVFTKKALCIGDICLLHFEGENFVSLAGGSYLGVHKKHASRVEALKAFPENVILSDVWASLGNAQMKILEKSKRQLSEIQQHIVNELQGSPVRNALLLPQDRELTSLSLATLLNGSMKDAIKFALKHNIEMLPAFTVHSNKPDDLPNSQHFARNTVLLPLRIGLKKDDIALIIKILRSLP